MSSSGNGRGSVVLASIGGALVAASAALYYGDRIRRSRWLDEEDRAHGSETTYSVIDHFKSLILDEGTTVEEANKRRTASYYLKMRESHSKSLVLGVGNHRRLIQLREREVARSLQYWRQGNQSHRTIVVMCDDATRGFLADARRRILEALDYSTDIHTRGAWIPPLNIIPEEGENLQYVCAIQKNRNLWLNIHLLRSTWKICTLQSPCPGGGTQSGRVMTN